jgi:very-short-patch-repair endonuclease
MERVRGVKYKMRTYNLTELKDRRRELRKRSTPQEDLLWEELRNRKLGPKFRRQHSVGRYILDFYCKEKRLLIEIDGGVHNTTEARGYDAVRDKYFRELDFKILRFTNDEVERNMEKVLERIKECF